MAPSARLAQTRTCLGQFQDGMVPAIVVTVGAHSDTVMALAIAWHSIVGTTRADAWIAAMEADMEASTIPALQMPKGGQWDTQRRMG